MTTQDCKDFLIHHFSANGITTLSKEWKRKSKYKEGDIICRDFIHTSLGSFTVLEDSSGLSIKDNQTQHTSDNFVLTTFSSVEKQKAKELVAQYTQNAGDVEFHPDWPQYSHALGSQFYFFFPKGVYGNYDSGEELSLDTPLVPEGDYVESYNIMFQDKENSDIDLYASNILTLGLLPPSFSFCDEYHMDFNSDCPVKTVKELVKVLMSLGIEHLPGDCLFDKAISKISYTEEKFKPNKQSEIFSQDAIVSKLLKDDNSTDLEKMLNDGLDINCYINSPKKDSLISIAYKYKALKCIELLFAKNIDIWKQTHLYSFVGRDCITYDMLLFPELLKHMKKQLPTENIVDKMSQFLYSVNTYKNKVHIKETIQFIKDNLNPMENNDVILYNITALSETNVPIVLKTISSASDEQIQSTIIARLHEPYLAHWILEQRPVDLSHLKVKDKDKDIITYIQDEMKDLKEKIDRDQRRGLSITLIPSNGIPYNRTDVFINQYKSYDKILKKITSNSTRLKP